jgi:hypothetical protein
MNINSYESLTVSNDVGIFNKHFINFNEVNISVDTTMVQHDIER